MTGIGATRLFDKTAIGPKLPFPEEERTVGKGWGSGHWPPQLAQAASCPRRSFLGANIMRLGHEGPAFGVDAIAMSRPQSQFAGVVKDCEVGFLRELWGHMVKRGSRHFSLGAPASGVKRAELMNVHDITGRSIVDEARLFWFRVREGRGS
ncbi:hypothetical protein [Rhizobium sp. LjRoot258]|uniref:hypothetical protein n=1 Tax=Rhizobium sp. LjRoot258 TaxID=3342299 RepID=UPI003ECFF55F